MDRPDVISGLPAHHTRDGFQNPFNHENRGLWDVLKWQLDRGPREAPPIPPEEIRSYVPEYAQPQLERIQHPEPGKIQITWVGHATFLIQVNGLNILTDPIFSERCSPVSFAGPKRAAQPGLQFEDLPEIHAVVLSHNHYDHLDEPTIERLGNTPKYFAPLGLAKWLLDKGIDNFVELDWWGSNSFDGLDFYCVPSQHFSGRTPFDRNETLWSGWVLESDVGCIFFAGDTGYSPDFEKIGDRFGPIDVSLIPIGAYRPRWFMNPVHVDPPEAVKIHLDVRSKQSIGMHWGTFRLADELLAEPPVYLRKALQEAGVREEAFVTMKFGETFIPD